MKSNEVLKYLDELHIPTLKRLKSLRIGSDVPGYYNAQLNSNNFDLAAGVYNGDGTLNTNTKSLLEEVVLTNLTALNGSIDLSGSEKLKSFRAVGTIITSVSLADGVQIETLHLPKTITGLKLTEPVALQGILDEPGNAEDGFNKGLYINYNDIKVNIKYIDSTKVSPSTVDDVLKDLNAIIVPGGFGKRGIEGKINAIKYARENNIPFLGICLGMQLAVVEFARNVLHLDDANSEEFSKESNNKVIHIMNEQKDVKKKGGTMRLGAYPCVLKKGSMAMDLYGGIEAVYERHRHRYEFNNDYRELFEENGMECSGLSPDMNLVEIVEYKKHPYFIASQFHPEFKSRPNRPSPLFDGLIKACMKK